MSTLKNPSGPFFCYLVSTFLVVQILSPSVSAKEHIPLKNDYWEHKKNLTETFKDYVRGYDRGPEVKDDKFGYEGEHIHQASLQPRVYSETPPPISETPPLIEEELSDNNLQNKQTYPVREPGPGLYLKQEEDLPGNNLQNEQTYPIQESEPSFFLKQIEIEGNTIFNDKTIKKAVPFYRDQNVTMAQLNKIAEQVTSFYNKKGYTLAEAYVPDQKVAEGNIKLVVEEGKIGTIQIMGNEKTKSKDYLKRLAKIKEAGAFKEQSLEQILLDLNSLMGVTIKSTLYPGELPGTTNMVLNISETTPYTFSFDANNYGSRFTGKYRFGFNASAGNLLSLGDQFLIRSIRSDQNQNFINPSYLYFFNKWGVSLKGSYTYSEFSLGEDLAALKAGGNAHIFNVEIGWPFYRSREKQLELQMGSKYRRYRNFLLGTTSSEDDIINIYIGLNGNIKDPFQGWTFFNFLVQQGVAVNPDDNLLSSRLNSNGGISLAKLNLTRYQNTNLLNSYFILKSLGQVVSSRALSPDQFFIGGMGTVRGYPQGEHSGDTGFVLSSEFVLPFPGDFSLGFGDLDLAQILSFTGFYDFGRVIVRNALPGEEDSFISGYGFGVQINFPKLAQKIWVPSGSLVLSYARPHAGPPPSDGGSQVFYLDGTMSF